VPEKRLIELNDETVEDKNDELLYEDDLIAVPEDDLNFVSTHRHRHLGVSVVTARYRAHRVLGLNDEEHGVLFDGDNTFADVQRLVNKFRQEELMRRARQARWQAEQLKATPAQASADPAADGTVE
jgi:hypothetical protein